MGHLNERDKKSSECEVHYFEIEILQFKYKYWKLKYCIILHKETTLYFSYLYFSKRSFCIQNLISQF